MFNHVSIGGFIFINISVFQQCAVSEDEQELIITFIDYVSFGRGVLY